jgi:hypothetical protein
VCQQVQNRGTKGRLSQAEEQRTQCVSRCKTEGPRAGTYTLNAVSTGAKWRDQGQALTNWRAEDTVCQQMQNRGIKGRHSHPGQQRTQCVSRCKTDEPRAGTHFLKSRGCSALAGAKWRDQRKAVTNWRTEDMACQQMQNRGTEGRHSPTGEQRMCSVRGAGTTIDIISTLTRLWIYGNGTRLLSTRSSMFFAWIVNMGWTLHWELRYSLNALCQYTHCLTARLTLSSKLLLCTVKSIKVTASSFNAPAISSTSSLHHMFGLCISTKQTLAHSQDI